MKILPLTSSYNYGYLKKSNNSSHQTSNPVEYKTGEIKFAYRDYNINFTGRTPEDFYAQDFNRENMPRTMKDYLYYDYENRQHIPPEQMMKEVFKYIEIADNFDDVKNIYPKETLFNNLHENNIKSRKGVLSEIKVARELSEAPLLKDGSDDFGMYLLKKIYLEGKTLKEISKDFLEKDINDEYKGFITEPINYATLSAYGIEYPNLAFWKSFIATRDEYKKFFVTLPKNSAIPGVNKEHVSHSHGTSSKIDEVEESNHTRRYNIKSHRKKEIAKDLTDKKPIDAESTRKTLVKRFGKDDPEASFILRYSSPIMALAAERVHLSEEMRAFDENEKLYGKSCDEKTRFGRFWKQNPDVLKNYSYAIADTIDMFEDIYGAGGMIGINTDLEAVTRDSKNQKIIDFVSPEFLELLSYTQQITPKRNELYAKHDELQKLWEAHFIERYGDPEAQMAESEAEAVEEEMKKLSLEESLRIEAERNGAQVRKLKLKDGGYAYLTANINEVFEDALKNHSRYFPTRYAAKYIAATRAENFSDKYKLTLAARQLGEEYDDDQLMPDDEYREETYKMYKYHFTHSKDEVAARFAVIDAMIQSGNVDARDPKLYANPIYVVNESLVECSEDNIKDFKIIMNNSKKFINDKYEYYTRPITKTEENKIVLAMFDIISKYDPNKSVLKDNDLNELILMMKDGMKNKHNKEYIKACLNFMIQDNPYSKSILQKDISQEYRNAKFEIVMNRFMQLLLASIEETPNLLTIFGNESYKKHRANLSPDLQDKLANAISQLRGEAKFAFFMNWDKLPNS